MKKAILGKLCICVFCIPENKKDFLIHKCVSQMFGIVYEGVANCISTGTGTADDEMNKECASWEVTRLRVGCRRNWKHVSRAKER